MSVTAVRAPAGRCARDSTPDTVLCQLARARAHLPVSSPIGPGVGRISMPCCLQTDRDVQAAPADEHTTDGLEVDVETAVAEARDPLTASGARPRPARGGP